MPGVAARRRPAPGRARLARRPRRRRNAGRQGRRGGGRVTAAPEADRPPAGLEPAPGGAGAAATREVSLSIEGMTCAACAVRIEKKLNKLDERPRDGELRDRDRAGHRAGRAAGGGADRRGGAGRVHGPARRGARRAAGRPDEPDAASRARTPAPALRLPAAPADRGADLLHPADRPVADAVAGPVAAVPRLAVAARRAARRRWRCGARGRSTGPR